MAAHILQAVVGGSNLLGYVCQLQSCPSSRSQDSITHVLCTVPALPSVHAWQNAALVLQHLHYSWASQRQAASIRTLGYGAPNGTQGTCNINSAHEAVDCRSLNRWQHPQQCRFGGPQLCRHCRQRLSSHHPLCKTPSTWTHEVELLQLCALHATRFWRCRVEGQTDKFDCRFCPH